MRVNDTKKRSVAKSISLKISGGATLALCMYYLRTHDYDGATIASIAFIWNFTVNLLIFFINDQIWNKFEWGREIIEE
jgi:uncharacterized membrane protein